MYSAAGSTAGSTRRAKRKSQPVMGAIAGRQLRNVWWMQHPRPTQARGRDAAARRPLRSRLAAAALRGAGARHGWAECGPFGVVAADPLDDGVVDWSAPCQPGSEDRPSSEAEGDVGRTWLAGLRRGPER